MKNILVGNLSFNASEGALRALFEEYGTVGRVSIVTDRDTGQQRGFGFVEMNVDAEGERAIEVLSGKELNGRALTVKRSPPKSRPSIGRRYAAEQSVVGGSSGGRRGWHSAEVPPFRIVPVSL